MQKQEAITIIENTFSAAFDEANFTLFVKNLLNDLDTTKYNHYAGNLIKDAYRKHVKQYKRIGKYTDPNGDAMDVLIVEVTDQYHLDHARTSLRNFVITHLDSFEKDYALVAFYSHSDGGADWRFSFVKLEYKTKVNEGKIKQEKELTPAKRYSFLVGEHEKAHTAKKQLLPLLENIYNNPTIEELEGAFSIEAVTDEFFEQYKTLFVSLTEQFEQNHKLKTELAAAGIEIPRFTKKLLGQIVFLYFLQKKGWMGVPKVQKWGTGEKRFLQKLFDEAIENGKNFFGDFLQYLFYEALAHKHNDEGVQGYFAKLKCKVPFLNGGLFEADYDWENDHIAIPNELFRNTEKIGKNGDIGSGVLDVFDRYNFTIKEDEPLEKEVAVDPEMLGKVFENMLEVTERKSKGAFYTPREIVHYMCQESLIHYLDNAVNTYSKTYQELGNSQIKMFGNEVKKDQQSIMFEKESIRIPKEDIEIFIRKGFFTLENDQRVIRVGKETVSYHFQLPETIRNHAELLDQKLIEIRVCDPTIGSGAFPVGMLHEIVNARLVLKPHLKNQGNPVNLENPDSDYAYQLKRHTIQECIYGVDIDASAIDIARLRLWLSLVVDEEDLDTIEALPNLDYKIVCGNSLIGIPQGVTYNIDIEKELEILKDQFFTETDETSKKELRTVINSKIQEQFDFLEPIIGYKIDFDFKLFFSEVWHEKGGFDVLIGNPPYISNWSQSKENREGVLLLDRLYKDFLVGHWDIFLCFIPKAISILKQKGICSFILPTSFFKEKHSTKVREIFINELKVIELLDFENEVIFDNVARQTGIFLVQKEKVKSNEIKIKNGIMLSERLVEQSFFKSLKNFAFKLTVSEKDILIYRKIIKDSQKLGLHVCINTGVVAHSKLGSSINFKKDDVIHKEYQEGFKPYVIGSNISRYKITFAEDYIDYDSKANFFHRPKFKLLFESPKIIVRRISGKNNYLMACYDENKYYSNDNLMHVLHWTNELLKFQKPEKKWSIVVDSNLSLKYILSIMESDVFTFYFSKFLSTDTLQGTYSSIYPEDLREIPIKPLKESEQKPFVIFVEYLLFLNLRKSNTLITSYFDNILNCCAYEIYFPSELKQVGKDILKHLGDLEPITDEMSEEQKLAIIQSEFARLYDPNHPVRLAVETLGEVEEVRIIREALK